MRRRATGRCDKAAYQHATASGSARRKAGACPSDPLPQPPAGFIDCSVGRLSLPAGNDQYVDKGRVCYSISFCIQGRKRWVSGLEWDLPTRKDKRNPNPGNIGAYGFMGWAPPASTYGVSH